MSRYEEIAKKANELCNDPNNDYKSTEDLCKIMAEWADQTMVDKVCQYLFDNCHGEKLSLRMIKDLRKAMEQ